MAVHQHRLLVVVVVACQRQKLCLTLAAQQVVSSVADALALQLSTVQAAEFLDSLAQVFLLFVSTPLLSSLSSVCHCHQCMLEQDEADVHRTPRSFSVSTFRSSSFLKELLESGMRKGHLKHRQEVSCLLRHTDVVCEYVDVRDANWNVSGVSAASMIQREAVP